MKNIKNYINLYKTNKNYKRNLFPLFRTIKNLINFEFESILDYGCGQSNMSELFNSHFKCKTYKYDPGIEEYSIIKKNIKYDLILNCDVMEHIPVDEVDIVLKEISQLSSNVFFNIYLTEAKTILPDGTNAHCTVMPISWWKNKLEHFFKNVVIVPSSYKNSVSFITWKIDRKTKFAAYFLLLIDVLEYLIWLFRIKILRRS